MKNKRGKIKSRHQITFEGFADQMAVALAQLGQTNASITNHTCLTDGQINYRLRKAKDYNSAYTHLRRQWRHGESTIFMKVKDDALALLRAEINRTLPIAIIREEPNGKAKVGPHS